MKNSHVLSHGRKTSTMDMCGLCASGVLDSDGSCGACKRLPMRCNECNRFGDMLDDRSDLCNQCGRFSCSECGQKYHYVEEEDTVLCNSCYPEKCRTMLKCPKAHCSTLLPACQFEKPACYAHEVTSSQCCNCDQMCCDACGTYPGGATNDTSDFECYQCLNGGRTLNCAMCDKRVHKWKVCGTIDCDAPICTECWLTASHYCRSHNAYRELCNNEQ